MTTAEKLEAITDRGKFEKLATAVLRNVNKDYEAVLHLGVNAAGEPVKSPLDGFCMVPGSTPPKFIMVQHTTTERNQLEKKWLYDRTAASRNSSNEDGDLIKALHLIGNLKKNFPNAQFLLVLTTNQNLPADLPIKVYAVAATHDIGCDIWDQSRFADFLDTKPEGQWLRKDYLGIPAEILSRSLLQSICLRSLGSYERELLVGQPDTLILRGLDQQVIHNIHDTRYSCQILIGQSGFGKSTIAYQALHQHLVAGGLGLWLPAQLIGDSISLESALSKVLRDFYPTLSLDAGKAALNFVEDSKFLIVMDDLNRTNSPSQLLSRILTWTSPIKASGTDTKQTVSPFLILCPVWPQVWGTIDFEYNKASWIDIVSIGPMTPDQGAMAIRSLAKTASLIISTADAIAYSDKLDNDPILIGLFGLMLKTGSIDINALTRNVVERFIRTSVSEASLGARYLPADFRATLINLASKMLRQRRLYPSWEEVQNWFRNDPEQIAILRELIRLERLCRLNTDADQVSFVFRHDRIQEKLLTDVMVEELKKSADASDLLDEPYYAEIIGRALVRFAVNKLLLKEISFRNPLALIEAIRHLGNSITDYENAIIDEVKEWAIREVPTRLVPEAVFDAIVWSLVEIDSPAVLDITQSFPHYPLVLLARLRNGSAESGAEYCAQLRDFEPQYNNSLRDRILTFAVRNYREQIIHDLKHLMILPDITDNKRKGFFALAGYMATDQLKEAIDICWNLTNDKVLVLQEAIWAASHCSGSQPAKLLDPPVHIWASLPENDKRPGYPDRMGIATNLQFAFVRGIPESIIHYFTEVYESTEALRRPIAHIFQHLDSPSALSLVVRHAAEIDRSIDGTDRFSPWLLSLGDGWSSSSYQSRRLSQQSIEWLSHFWRNEKNDKYTRRAAFHIWLKATGPEHLSDLSTVPTNTARYKEVLIKRMQLGDKTVVPELLAVLPFGGFWDGYLYRYAHSVWCDELVPIVDKELESFKENIPADYSGGQLDPHHHMSELLMQIPPEVAESFLQKHWAHLQYSPLFIQAAVYVGTPVCLALAHKAIANYPSERKPMQDISYSFGFMNGEMGNKLTKRHLDNLLPYIDQIDPDELWQVAEVCQRLGIPEWSKQYLSGKLDVRWRKQYLPTDEDLLQELDELALDEHGEIRIANWVEDAQKRHDLNQRILSIVDRWLGMMPSKRRFQLAAKCVSAIGDRDDLKLLDKYIIEDEEASITKIKQSTRFAVSRRTLD